MTNFKPGIEYAKEQDLLDPLAHFRTKFHIPKNSHGEEWLYFTGNSLGLQPKETKNYIQQELDDWAKLGVEGHFEAKNPWMPYHEFLTETMAEIVGAKPIEVVIMNTLTTNLHLLMVSFYQPTILKHKILIESDAFPSDRYAVETQLRFHGFDPTESLIEWSPRKGETLLNIEDLESILQSNGDEIALLLIGGVNYYTGQYLDLKKISELGHEKGCKVGIDLAHGVGNIQPNLHESGVDFAAWCTYKYMNSGPGSLGGVFVHEGWQLSNPPILSMAAIKASLALFSEVGMPALIKKSKQLTGYLEYLILKLNNKNISIITPKDPEQRGCQLSIQVKNANKSLHNKLTLAHVITDWRTPDVIRCAPVPFYNSFEDVFKMVEQLKKILNA